MKVFVAGGTGATGKLLVDQLLARGHHVRAVVRSPHKIPEKIRDLPNLELIKGSLLEVPGEDLREYVADCEAIASCLGHNLTFKGMYGKPRRLVTDAAKMLTSAAKAENPGKGTKFVLMNTVGNRNRDLNENIGFGERIVIGLLRILVPPHVDNEQAADYLRTKVGQNNPHIEWAAVRPDSLIDEDEVSEYETHPSPTSSAIFGSRKTSRINVAHFMAELIIDDQLWAQWKGRMPVVYNRLNGEHQEVKSI